MIEDTLRRSRTGARHKRGQLPRLVLVDARGPVHETVRAILERASVGHDVFVVAGPESAADSVGSERRTAVLIHAGVQPRPGTPPLGPLLASLCHAKSPEARIMLYTGGNVARHERALAQQGLTTPVVNERRLADSFDSIRFGSSSRSSRRPRTPGFPSPACRPPWWTQGAVR